MNSPSSQPRPLSVSSPGEASASFPVVVAVDGTSGSGKSSTCRGVAARLGLRYLDTGAQFRGLTWWMLREGIDVHDGEAVAASSATPSLVSGTNPADPTIDVDGVDVRGPIRSAEVTSAVSPVSSVPAIRQRLLDLQRATIEQSIADGVGIVVEGRDIASVVWPQAEVKLYVTADTDARAARRAAEEGGTDLGVTAASLAERDRIDSGRAAAPLKRADGAVHLDTTPYTLAEVIDLVVDLVTETPTGQVSGSASSVAP